MIHFQSNILLIMFFAYSNYNINLRGRTYLKGPEDEPMKLIKSISEEIH